MTSIGCPTSVQNGSVVMSNILFALITNTCIYIKYKNHNPENQYSEDLERTTYIIQINTQKVTNDTANYVMLMNKYIKGAIMPRNIQIYAD